MEPRRKRIDNFFDAAIERLPGFLFSFNIADFKRRNGYLSHAVGDKDIHELDVLLNSFPGACAERVSGDRWLLFSRNRKTHQVRALLERYARTDPIVLGFKITARKNEQEKLVKVAVPSEIRRAVRCLYCEVKTSEELRTAAERIAASDWALPVNEPLLLSDVEKLDRDPHTLAKDAWRCADDNTFGDASCPLCGGKSFAWEDGDCSPYTADGHCRDCDAEISMRGL